MLFFALLSSWPAALGIFLISLVIVIATSARFTSKLEEVCEAFHLSIGVLSLLSALGANIPNYVSSALAILASHDDVGIGIIVGSNIYNIAIILGLCTWFTAERVGITLAAQEKRDVYIIACYSVIITLLSFVVTSWLPGVPLLTIFHLARLAHVFLVLTSVLVLVIFGAFLLHVIRNPRGKAGTSLHHDYPKPISSFSLLLLGSEVLFTLVIALGGVLAMVQSGQMLTADLHMPSILAGLFVLAVATSLPNTVVAVSLVRTGEAAACVEEICSSGSINIALGIVLPLLFWQGALLDHFLLLLDEPLLLVLTTGLLFCIVRGRVSRGLGVLLLSTYVTWMMMRIWI